MACFYVSGISRQETFLYNQKNKKMFHSFMPKSISTILYILHLTYQCKFLTDVYFILVIEKFLYTNFILQTKLYQLEQATVKCMRGLLMSMMGQREKARQPPPEMQFPKLCI